MIRFFTYLILILFLPAIFAQAQTINLGTFGSTCPVNASLQNLQINTSIQEADLLNQYQSNLNIKFYFTETSPASRQEETIDLGNYPSTYDNQRILVFSIKDPDALNLLVQFKVTYGIVVNFDSLAEISAFRETIPNNIVLQPGNIDFIKFFHVKKIPTLISIKNGTAYVEASL